MKNKVICLFTVMIICKATVCQLVGHGSFSIAALCKDGIIIGADTRSAFWGTANGRAIFDGDPLFYFDTTQKIFPMKNFIICCIGQGTFGTKFTSYYVKEYEKTLTDTASVDGAKEGFTRFISLNYPDYLQAFLTTAIFIVGYQNNQPSICAGHNRRWYCGNYIEADSLCDFDYVYSASYTCEQMADIIEKTIRDYTEKYSKEKFIGGPIMIAKITPDNKTYWIRNKPTREARLSIPELLVDYKNDEVKITFDSKERKESFEKLFKYYFP